MSFVLLGFDQSASMRQFRFENVGTDHGRTAVAVLADLVLARRYHIELQALPLVCREFLEQSDAASFSDGVITLPETYMAESRRAFVQAADEKKAKRGRPPVSPNTGKAWRTTRLS